MTPADRFIFHAPLDPDDPGDGALQLDASNATLCAREAEFRTLWEHPGSDNIFRNLDPPYGLENFPWYAEATDGIFAHHAGVFRVRSMGDLSDLPRLLLTARAAAPMGHTLGLIVLAFPVGAVGGPNTRGAVALVTTTSTTVTGLSATLNLDAARPGLVPFSATEEESGPLPLLDVYVGAWCTIGSGGGAKGELYGVTLSLVSP